MRKVRMQDLIQRGIMPIPCFDPGGPFPFHVQPGPGDTSGEAGIVGDGPVLTLEATSVLLPGRYCHTRPPHS